MPVRNSGAPLAPSSRSPSPDVAAMTGCASATAIASAQSAERTVPELTARWPPRFGRVLQPVIDRLECEVGVGNAEPVPVLVALSRISPFPEPHEADFQPRPLVCDAVKRTQRVARLQRRRDPPKLLDGERRWVDIPAHLGCPDGGRCIAIALHHLPHQGWPRERDVVCAGARVVRTAASRMPGAPARRSCPARRRRTAAAN